MIIGTGIDIVQVNRFDSWVNNEKLLSRFFHPEEVKYILGQNTNQAETIAARFAAKEALGKALGTGLRGFALKDIWVRRDGKGKPYIEVFPAFLEITKSYNCVKIHLSISHEKEYACAIVILEN